MILQSELIRLRKALYSSDMINDHISSVSIGWHVDHSLKVVKAICDQLLASNPSNYHRRFSFSRSYIFMRGSIPRGRARSPKDVNPTIELNYQELLSQLDDVEVLLKKVEGMPKNSYFTHRLFGDLNLKRAIFFLRLHTAHHLKIIDEIEYSHVYSKEPIEMKAHA